MPLSEDMKKDLETLVEQYPIVLFMKGSAQSPRCGFSARVVAILNDLGASYTAVDILQSDELREGLKEFSEWPTFPQLYVAGEFLGGADIIGEMHEAGELAEALAKAA
ncbi:MAG: monothiol glutaredoxin, Grx4 family [Alphaproteobacteria bacterium CG_4_10_14_0_8_um_filter_53_9]|nr:MAG: monothiol glutaredoxin, Grx4 family [Alphaproteobacteria bacterium CG_4_10_14_0_8_um_filter_53_9]